MKKKYPTPMMLPSGRYRCQVTISGVRRSVTADSPQEAISAALLLRDHEEADARDRPLKDVIDEYITRREPVLSPSTIKAYRSYLSHRFRPYMDRKVSSMDRKTLQLMISEECKTTSPKTVKNAFSLVCAAMKEDGHPVTGVILPQVPPADRPWLTPEEILIFCREVHGQPCEIPALLALCSLRRSEIAALEWRDIDTKAGTIRIRRSIVEGVDGFVIKPTNKTAASSRTIPILIPQLKAALESSAKPDGRITSGHPNTIYTQINQVCDRAGLPRVGIHGLRHSFASLCHFLGIPEMECARLGGWSDLGTMRRIYTHLSEGQLTTAASAIRDFFRT